MPLLVSVALAAPPAAVVLPGDGVEGTVSVRLSPDDALAKVSDPLWVREHSGATTTVSVRTRQEACLLLDYTSPSFVTVAYTVRQCPTAHGVLSTLVASSDFSAYSAEWRVDPEGTGSRLTYRLHVTPTLPLPEALLAPTLRREVQAMMDALAAAFGA